MLFVVHFFFMCLGSEMMLFGKEKLKQFLAVCNYLQNRRMLVA